jgi:hypothetical protein
MSSFPFLENGGGEGGTRFSVFLFSFFLSSFSKKGEKPGQTPTGKSLPPSPQVPCGNDP